MKIIFKSRFPLYICLNQNRAIMKSKKEIAEVIEQLEKEVAAHKLTMETNIFNRKLAYDKTIKLNLLKWVIEVTTEN